MAVEMLKPPPPPPPEVPEEVICGNCKCTLSYLKGDVQRHSGTDTMGYSEGNEWIYCVNCGAQVTLKTW